jgi:hypothetical protein
MNCSISDDSMRWRAASCSSASSEVRARTRRWKRPLPETSGSTTISMPAATMMGRRVPLRTAKPRAVPRPIRLYWLLKAWAR